MKKQKKKVIFFGFAIAIVISFACLTYMDFSQYEYAPMDAYNVDRGYIG